MSEAAPQPGADVVARVLVALEPAPPWLALEPQGFAWWPIDRVLRVRADGPQSVAGEPVWMARASLELRRDVDGGADTFAALSEWNVAHAGSAALRWNGETRAVTLESATCVRTGREAVAARDLAAAIVLMLGEAGREREWLADALGGTDAVSAAPGTSVRAEPDALTEAWRGFACDPEDAPPLAEWLERAALTEPAPWRRATMQGGGLHAELPLAAEPGHAPGEGVAMLHLVAQPPHPVLGAGLLSVLRLPPTSATGASRPLGPATAALLNEAEAREVTGFESPGAWCVHPAAGFAHVAFVAAALTDEESPVSLAWLAGRRARWAEGVFEHVAGLRRES